MANDKHMDVLKKRLVSDLDLLLDGTLGAATESIGPYKLKMYRVYSFLIRIDILHKEKKLLGKEKNHEQS